MKAARRRGGVWRRVRRWVRVWRRRVVGVWGRGFEVGWEGWVVVGRVFGGVFGVVVWGWGWVSRWGERERGRRDL